MSDTFDGIQRDWQALLQEAKSVTEANRAALEKRACEIATRVKMLLRSAVAGKGEAPRPTPSPLPTTPPPPTRPSSSTTRPATRSGDE